MTIAPGISLSYPATGYTGMISGYRTPSTEAPQGYRDSQSGTVPSAHAPPTPGQEPEQIPSSQASPQASETETQEQTENTPPQGSDTAPDGSLLTQEELRLIEELKQTDQEVRQHEMAHVAVGGSLVTSGAQYQFQTGPDGQKYAVAGEVGIDTSAVPGDPQATMEKMGQVKRAAMAPANPSAQDLRVAAKATATAAEAAGELTMLMAKQKASQDETKAFGSPSQAADAYQKVSSLPEEDTHSFQLAV